MRIIGDIHGKIKSYAKLCQGHKTIQLGDFGMGFFDNDEYDFLHDHFEDDHYFIRGNHDHYDKAKEFKGFIDDGTVINGAMFVGGAWSIDKEWRTPMLDWWPDEQINYGQFLDISEKYRETKPRIMFTHDGPQTIMNQIFKYNPPADTFTGKVFDVLFQEHQPEYWFFGHHHLHVNMEIMGTKFICLEELQYMDIDYDF